MRRRTKYLIGGAALVIVLGGAGLASLASQDRGGTAVRVEAATTRDLVATVRASGWVRPRRSVAIQSDLMGRIVELSVEEGDSVSAGQLLLRLEPTPYEAAVSQARAAVSEARAREAQARASLLQAQQEAGRTRTLRERNLVSPQTLEQAETEARVQEALHEAAEHSVAQSTAQLEEAEDQLSKTVIRAPMAGIVTRLDIEEGEMAIVGTMNNPGSLLLTVSDLAVMEAVLRIHETDVPRIEVGDSVAVEIDAFPRQAFTGRVTRIGHSALRPPEQMAESGSTQSQAIDFEVVVTLDEPPATLRPDLSATGEVVTGRSSGVVAVPIIALTIRELPPLEAVAEEGPGGEAATALTEERRQDQEGVFVVRDGRAHFVPVEVGITGTEHFEIVDGLSAGDSVVAGPYDAIRLLEDGDEVRPMGNPDAPPGRP